MSLELLKMLTPKTSSLERSTRGANETTWEDVAASLSKVKPLASLYSRICFVGDRARIHDFERSVMDKVLRDDRTQEFVVKIGTLRELVKLAVAEEAVGQMLPIDDKSAPMDKVRLLGLPNAKMWYRKYNQIYVFLGNFMGGLQSDAAVTIAKNLRK